MPFEIVTIEQKELLFEIVTVEHKGLSSEIVTMKEIGLGIIIFLLGFLNFLRSLLVKFIASIGNRFFLIDVATYKVCKHLVTIEKTVGGNGIITKICLSMLNVTMYIKSLSHSPKFHQLFPSIG